MTIGGNPPIASSDFSSLVAVGIGSDPGAAASFHVALDTMMGRRTRFYPEVVVIDGFLLLDTGDYELVTAYVPLDIFWKMKALDIVGNTRSRNRARAAHPGKLPDVGSVWLVDARLDAPRTMADLNTQGIPTGSGTPTDDAVDSRGTARRVEEVMDYTSTAHRNGRSGAEAPAHAAAKPKDKVFRMHILSVSALERVAIERAGPQFIEAFHVRDMLPRLQPD